MTKRIGNQIEYEGAKAISESLKINTSLNTLILGSVLCDGNQIGDEGVKAISETLQINTSLSTLNLWSDEEIRNEMRDENEMNENG